MTQHPDKNGCGSCPTPARCLDASTCLTPPKDALTLSSAMKGLMPCPFCNNSPISCWHGADAPGMEDCGYWAVECHFCGKGSPTRFVGVHADNQESAEEAWNAPLRTKLSHELPKTMSEFVHAATEVREAIGQDVVKGAIERQRANEQDRDNKVGQWWCTHCRNWVPGQHVTYQENHDPREGGCGSRCTETAPSSIAPRFDILREAANALDDLSGKTGAAAEIADELRALHSGAHVPPLKVQEINDALDVAECCVHDQIRNPNERDHVKDGLQKVRELALATLAARTALAEQAREIVELRVAARSAIAAIPTAKGDNAKSGWTLDFAFLQSVAERAAPKLDGEPGLEDVEAILCALIDMGHARSESGGANG